jgi:hypothetical protein
LQGYDPEKFKIHGSFQTKWSLIGNTIPTRFTQMIGENIRKCVSLTEGVDHLFRDAARGLSGQRDADGGGSESDDSGESIPITIHTHPVGRAMEYVGENGFEEFIGGRGGDDGCEPARSTKATQQRKCNRRQTQQEDHVVISSGMMRSQASRMRSKASAGNDGEDPSIPPGDGLHHTFGMYNANRKRKRRPEMATRSKSNDAMLHGASDVGETGAMIKHAPCPPERKRAKVRRESDDDVEIKPNDRPQHANFRRPANHK